jgi:uncharacterized membrane protein
VITETLLPLMEKYGSQLEVIGVDISQPYGQALFGPALEKLGVDMAGVPFLVIDDVYLVGSVDIPEKFPGLVETYLRQGGVDWPDLPGLQEALAASAQAATATAAVSTASPSTLQPTPLAPTTSPSSITPIETPGAIPSPNGDAGWREKFSHDPAGNMLSVFTLVFMLASVLWTATIWRQSRGRSTRGGEEWIIPILCLIGLGVAGYLAYVETAQVTAVCGPVGDCNTVQQSEYARLFGILPIGVLGILGYLGIITAWLIGRFIKGRPARVASVTLFLMTAFGTLFSIYLTFLEPFVIGATCAWCLTSAVIMTLLMLLSVRPAKAAVASLTRSPSLHRRRMQVGAQDD